LADSGSGAVLITATAVVFLGLDALFAFVVFLGLDALFAFVVLVIRGYSACALAQPENESA
jgi:hypothetical protein